MNKFGAWLRGLNNIQKVLLALGVLALLGVATGDQKSTNLTRPSESKPTPAQAVQSEPTTTTKEIVETESVPYASSTVEDDSLAQGTTQIRTAGVNGVKTNIYSVTFTDGKETGRQLKSSIVSTPPTNEVIAKGTRSSNCNPNYSGCVPNASDVDCAGGSGNGPAYVDGPISVLGSDVYGLDRDGDGVACE